MSLIMKALFICILFFAALSESRPLPAFLREGGSHFLVRSLGSACYSMTSIQSALPCNPAAIASDRRPLFDSSAFLGADVEMVNLAREAVDNGNEEALIRYAADTQGLLQAEASLQTTILGATRGVTIEPFRVVYYSKTENTALPVVDLIAAQQRTIKAQIGSFVTGNLAAGVQLRYSHLRVIDSYFTMTEAFVEGSEDLWVSEDINQFFLEPGALYSWDDVVWEPQISATITQLGYSTPKSEAFPTSPELFIGSSVKPMLPWGLLEVGLQFHLNSEVVTWKDVPRFAASYKIAMITAAMSAGENDGAISLMCDFNSINFGFAFRETRDNNALFAQLGYQL